jgi:hypothetical protein
MRTTDAGGAAHALPETAEDELFFLMPSLALLSESATEEEVDDLLSQMLVELGPPELEPLVAAELGLPGGAPFLRFDEGLFAWHDGGLDAERGWEELSEQLRREGILQGSRPGAATFGQP